MPRKHRLEYPGAVYHVMSGGDRREKIFLDDTEELKRRGWKEGELAARRKNDPEKLAMAARLRRETTLSIKAIAARVHLGTSKSANATLHRHLRQSAGNNPAQAPLGL